MSVSKPAPASVLRYLVALAAVTASFLFRLSLNPVWGKTMPFMIFYPAIAVSARSGQGPGLLATGLSAVLVTLTWVTPVHEGMVLDVSEALALTLFLAIGIFLTGLEASLRRAKSTAEARAQQLTREMAQRLRIEEAHERLLQEKVAMLECAGEGMLGVDLEGRCVFMNATAGRMLGCAPEQAIGQHVADLVTFAREDGPGPQPGERAVEWWRLEEGGQGTARRKDGTSFYAACTAKPIVVGGLADGTIVTIADVTRHRQAEEQIEQSLRQKEVLLKEIHHRVKNNLQIISSLLMLQSSYTEDPKALALFEESANRIRSMALVHEKLYQSQGLSGINLGEYLRSLVAQLEATYELSGTVTTRVEAQEVRLALERAVPCALLVNELVANAFEHGFPDGRSGSVLVRLRAAAGRCVLVVHDDGVGLPAGFDVRTTDSLGLRLVSDLTEQLHGKLTLRQERGTTILIVFPLK